MSVLSIYGGDVTAGSIDGDLITTERKIALKGTRGNPVTKTYALRAISTSKPACVVKITLDGPQKDYWYRARGDRAAQGRLCLSDGALCQ